MPTTLSAISYTLQKTLSAVIMDKEDGIEASTTYSKYYDVRTMDGAYVDDVTYAGVGLITEKPEGAAMSHSTIKQGAMTRYMARTFAQQVDITREAVDDCKYSQVIAIPRHQKRAIWHTVDIDAALVLVRAVTAGYVGADGQVLASASHTLPNGGTYSNLMSVAMSPSRVAVNIALSTLKKTSALDGVTYAPAKAVKILCPVEQGFTWQEILLSPKAPEAGQFNAVNTVNRYFGGVSDIVEIPYWNNTTTNWALKTDFENGLNWFWRTRPETNTWADNSGKITCHSIFARWARGWTDPRSIYFVNA